MNPTPLSSGNLANSIAVFLLRPILGRIVKLVEPMRRVFNVESPHLLWGVRAESSVGETMHRTRLFIGKEKGRNPSTRSAFFCVHD